jgi:hypothetical protein
LNARPGKDANSRKLPLILRPSDLDGTKFHRVVRRMALLVARRQTL